MTRRHNRWSALFLISLLLPACSSWQSTLRPVSDVVAEGPGSIRIRTSDGQTRTLRDPQLFRDSITTKQVLEYCARDRPDPCPETRLDGEPLTLIPVDRIESVELREHSETRTFLLVVGVIVAIPLAAGLAWALSDDPWGTGSR